MQLVRMKMKVKVTGTRNGVEWPPVGGTIDLPFDEAKRYAQHGYCEPVRDEAGNAVYVDDVAEEEVADEPVTPKPTKRPAKKQNKKKL